MLPASAADIAELVGGVEAAGGGVGARRARARLQLLARLGALLAAAVPEGFEVSACCVWQTATGTRLRPDVAVHRRTNTLGRLPAAPALCVDLLPRRRPDVAMRSFSRRGVDHYWQLDVERRRLEVYVREGDEFRHAETIGPATRTWADFGVGLVLLDLPDLLDPLGLFG